MTTIQLRFAPIIRVSTEKQEVQGESLEVQKKQIIHYVETLQGTIPDYCWQYKGQEHATPQYERTMIKKLLEDSSKDLFDAVIVSDPSRWSRDNLKSKEGLNVLKANGIKFFVGTTEYDLYNPTQNLFLGMSAEIGEFQAMEQSRKSIMSRIERAKRGIPSAGSIPFGRLWDQKTGWAVDSEKKKLVEQAAKRYLAGEGIRQISASIGMPFPTLWKYLTKIPSSTWTLHFNNERLNISENVDMQIPPLLDEATIAAIKERANASRTYLHGEIKNQYLLSRMIFCARCGYTMFGTINTKSGKRYYKHAYDNGVKCDFKKYVPADELENSVLIHIVHTFGDPERIQKAVERATPDMARLEELTKEKEQLLSELRKITLQSANIIDAIADNTITHTQVRDKMDKLRERESITTNRFNQVKDELSNMPDPTRVKRLSGLGMKVLQDAIKNTPEKALEKPYEWKRRLVENAFAGLNTKQKRLGIYMDESGNPDQPFKFEIRGIFEKTLLSLPLSDDYLVELFNLDSEYQDVTKELQSIRENITTSFTAQMRPSSPLR
jgi:DNA invertase Pin-like site-specific DNA recombinase/vacuolar-type H+-ATPase subunit E/Vma4